MLAALAGIFWGSMGIAAEVLMRDYAFATLDLVSLRLLGAGLMMLACQVLLGQKILEPFSSGGQWCAIVVYGFIMLAVQATFFLSIDASNTATAALMVTTVPLFVAGWEAFAEHRPFTKAEVLCVGLAIAGVSLLVTKGRLDAVDLSWGGVLWGLASAVCGAMGALQPRRVLKTVPVGVVVGWAMTIGGSALCLVNPPAVMTENWTWLSFSLWFYIAAIGTVAAFCFFLKSLQYIPPATASLLASFEPLSAVVLSVALLGLSLNVAECLGILLIFVMVVLVTNPPSCLAKRHD